MRLCINRRHVIAGLVLATGTRTGGASAQNATNAYDFSFDGIGGAPLPLAQFRGRALLIVNTASQCAYTSQYSGLQALWERYRARGLTVIGVPANDFGGQEPGADEDIAAFAGKDYGVTFPMAKKQVVTGAAAHPFYRWAARVKPGEAPGWNFHKYLIGRDGMIAATFASQIAPADPRLTTAIERVLATGA